jgi:hypothetical protein
VIVIKIITSKPRAGRDAVLGFFDGFRMKGENKVSFIRQSMNNPKSNQ